jgi:hypothetical protein
MMKGGDWTFGRQLVDGALGALDTPPVRTPSRIFTPQVLAPAGAKLSKSLLRERGRDALPADVEPWMLDTTARPGDVDNSSSSSGFIGGSSMSLATASDGTSGEQSSSSSISAISGSSSSGHRSVGECDRLPQDVDVSGFLEGQPQRPGQQ